MRTFAKRLIDHEALQVKRSETTKPEAFLVMDKLRPISLDTDGRRRL